MFDAFASGVQIDPPSTRTPFDYAGAVRIRRRFGRLLEAAHGRRCGYKIGFTSVPVQRALHISSPEFGRLYRSFVHRATPKIRIGNLCETYAEPELAFELAERLAGPEVTVDDVLNATRYVRPAIEIVDSRTGLQRSSVKDMIADNVLAARVVLGQEAVSPRDLDLSDLPVTVDVDGLTEEGNSRNVMGHPAAAVAWLARRLAADDDENDAIMPGDIIMTGSCTTFVPIAAGQSLTARFGQLPPIGLSLI